MQNSFFARINYLSFISLFGATKKEKRREVDNKKIFRKYQINKNEPKKVQNKRDMRYEFYSYTQNKIIIV